MQLKHQSNEHAVKAGSVAPRGGASLTEEGQGDTAQPGRSKVPSSTPAHRSTLVLPDYTHASHTGGGSSLPDEKAQGGVSLHWPHTASQADL